MQITLSKNKTISIILLVLFVSSFVVLFASNDLNSTLPNNNNKVKQSLERQKLAAFRPGALLQFDTAPPVAGDFDSYMSYVRFSKGANPWTQFYQDPLTFNVSSGLYGATTTNPNNWINFTVPQKYVEFIVSANAPNTTTQYTASAYDPNGAFINSTTWFGFENLRNVSIFGMGITSIQIRGDLANWELGFVIDDLYFENETMGSNPGHSLLKPVIQTPTNGSTVNGNISLTYLPAVDSQGHTVNYNITLHNTTYPTGLGLISYYSGTSYSFDSKWYSDGWYTLQVLGYDTTNNSITNMDQVSININNTGNGGVSNHTLSIPSIYNPYYGQTVSGMLNASWSSYDNQGHLIYYNVSLQQNFSPYTSYPLSVWTTATFYSNTSSIYTDGGYYLYVTAFDNFGLTQTNSVFFYINNTGGAGGNNHTLSMPTIYNPYYGQTVSGMFNASWYSYDSQGHIVYYNVTLQQNFSPYSLYNLEFWTTGTYFSYNTGNYTDGGYRLNVTAFDSFGLVQMNSVFFYINNTGGAGGSNHTLSMPMIYNPYYGQTVSGMFNASWSSYDSQGHIVYYNVTLQQNFSPYSLYNLEFWTTGTYFSYNTGNYTDGGYRLNVTAFDNFGLTQNNSVFFYINNTGGAGGSNHTLSMPMIYDPYYGQTVSGMFNASWSSYDSQGHIVYYNVTLQQNFSPYSLYNLEFWTTGTYFSYNTGNYTDGGYYLYVTAFDNFGLTQNNSVFFYINNTGGAGGNNHTLSMPMIYNPYYGQTVSGMFNASWSASYDSLNHTVYYNASIKQSFAPYYSYEVQTMTTGTFFSFDTLIYSDGGYSMEVTAFDNFGLTQNNSVFFYINNTGGSGTSNHTISKPIIGSPYENQTVFGMFNVSWSPAIDSYGHMIHYNLTMTQNFYPNMFYFLTSAASISNYMLNTTNYADGYYTLYLTATDGTIEVMSIRGFHIGNAGGNAQHLLPPVIQTPFNNSVVNGTINISWLQAVDSSGHNVTYTLHIWNMNASEIVTPPLKAYFNVNVTTLSFMFDTTQMKDGFYTVSVDAFDGHGYKSYSWIQIEIRNGQGGGTTPPIQTNHTISSPSITSHLDGDVISGIIKLVYNPANDTMAHDLTYNVTITDANGSVVYSGVVTDVSTLIDTTTLPDGTYEISVFAYDNFGLKSDVYSIKVTIDNSSSASTSTNTSSSNGLISTSPGFELVFALVSLLAIVSRRRRAN